MDNSPDKLEKILYEIKTYLAELDKEMQATRENYKEIITLAGEIDAYFEQG